MAENVRHLFFTGEKGVGKSTIVKKSMERFERVVGGFLTVKSEKVFPGKSSLHLLSLRYPLIPSAENFLTFCGEQNEETAARFDRLGCAALSDIRGAGLLVMDELGPHETEALLFRKAVLGSLDGSVPVLGVLQKADSPFLSEIRSRPDVEVMEVTHGNRDEFFSAAFCENMIREFGRRNSC